MDDVERRAGARSARSLTQWLFEDVPIARRLRSALTEAGSDCQGAWLLAWDKEAGDSFVGTMVDADGAVVDIRFHFEPHTDVGTAQLSPHVAGDDLSVLAAGLRQFAGEDPDTRAERLRVVEEALGLVFPDDYRRFMLTNDGSLGWTGGGEWLDLVSIDDLIDMNDIPQTETHPGLVVIGTNVGDAVIGFDTRSTPSPIVLVWNTSAGWSEAVEQAPSFSAFFERLQVEPYRFE